MTTGKRMKPRQAVPNASFCSYMAALHSTLQTSNDISRDARSRSPVDPEQGCTYNMNDCYEKLKKMVPYMPANRRLTKVEILQYVIDYIQDLQLALEIQPAARSTRRHSGNTANRVPLSVLPSNRKDSQVIYHYQCV